ncbi:thiamine phosphate synthase [Alkalibacterium kapii]|uniref:Thiamine-phosphate synthase n=1 Tax=Alkalibacterium kapii TaxID=426704 RepID=A0A511ASV9_9LACT|nr:thiamine phosphate synthase [Alkalibacterium kapii]GEK91186.1 thiamine-phosphate synthase [Alkalibacterium kapii]
MKNEIEKMLELYFIAGTQDTKDRSLPDVLKEALEAGITCFQYREKGQGSLTDHEEIKKMAKTCLDLCKKAGVPFVVNDDVSLAVDIGADGVHVGQDDLAIEETIDLAGSDMFVGLSVNNLKEFKIAEKIDGVSYIGIGPVYSTYSKADAKETIGLGFIEKVVAQKSKKPIVAIGGISEERAVLVRKTGVSGIAVISAITKSTDIKKTVTTLKKLNKNEV